MMEKSLVWILLILWGPHPVFPKPHASPPLHCIYNNKTNPYFHRESVPRSELSLDAQGRLIVSGCSACFTLWTEDDGLTILGQGCWSRQEDCTASSCNDYSLEGSPSKAKLCCCTAELCNGHIVAAGEKRSHHDRPSSLPPKEESFHYSLWTAPSYFGGLLLLILSILLLGGLLILCLVVRIRRSQRPSKPRASLKNNEASKLLLPISPPPRSDLSRTLGEEDLEVHFDQALSPRSIPASEKPSGRRLLLKVPASLEAYLNEAAIYESLPPHPSLQQLLYHAQDLSLRDGGVHLDQVLVFCNASPIVPLSAYLRENTLSWERLVAFLSAITDGVAHIHSESLARGSICHRNLSSDSIFVRGDGSLVIGDFSRSVAVAGSSVLLRSGAEVSASRTSFPPPSDPRYSAPEILEGSLNFRDAESAFKQGDVYSLGLLFWEISRRCEELYQGFPVPDWEPPFQTEALNSRRRLDAEAMKVLVSRYRSRPLFPSVWKESNPAVQLLRETIEDSWDQDGEARLTAFCVRERISELDSLWERYKKNRNNDLSPVNYNNSSSERGFNNLHSNNAKPPNQLIIKNDTVFHTNDFSKSSSWAGTPGDARNSVSRSKNDNVLSNQMPSLRLQPYQGLNPCKERNLNMQQQQGSGVPSSSDDTDLLLNSSSKDFTTEERRRRRPTPSQEAPTLYSPASPIPYTQNPLSEDEEKKTAGETPLPVLNLISKEHNREKGRSHSGWLGQRRKKKPNQQALHSSPPSSAPEVVVFVDQGGKACNLDIEKSLLSVETEEEG